MKKSKWEEYWQKRAVKAELALSTIAGIAEENEEVRIQAVIAEYYRSVAAGEVKDVPLDGDGERS